VKQSAAIVTIATGQSQSPEFDTQGAAFLGLNLPAAIDSATSITFLVSDVESGTFQKLTDGAGAEVALTVVAGVAVSPTSAQAACLAPWRYLKLRLGTGAAPVTATAARAIGVVLKHPV
jgi:hypothetical protein